MRRHKLYEEILKLSFNESGLLPRSLVLISIRIMGLSDLTSEILGIPEPSARFLLALYGGELLEVMGTRGRWQRPPPFCDAD